MFPYHIKFFHLKKCRENLISHDVTHLKSLNLFPHASNFKHLFWGGGIHIKIILTPAIFPYPYQDHTAKTTKYSLSRRLD